MFKRMLVLVTFFALLLLASAGATTGYAQGDEPLRGDITTLYRVADIYGGATGSNPAYLAAYSGALYFRAEGSDGAGVELWKYTPAGGALRVADINPGATGSYPKYLAVYDGALYFAADGDDGAGTELWSYDTTHGALRVVDIIPGLVSSNPRDLAAYNGSLYFSADVGGAGRELWKYDPVNGAGLVEDIKSVGSSGPNDMAVYSGALYFSAAGDGGEWVELWKYDPTNGAQLVADICTGSGGSYPYFLTVYNGALYFGAVGNDGTGYELWKYDLVHGADRVADIYPGVSSSYSGHFAVFNGSLYFQADSGDGAGVELWQYGNTSTVSIRSTGSLDGWVLESGETTNVGGTLNASQGTFQLGDNAQDRQFRSILSFDTSSLPDNAVVTVIKIFIRRQGIIGTNPFTTHGNIKVDIRKGAFGTGSALQIGDFQAAASKASIGTILNLPDPDNWYTAKLLAAANRYVNPTGVTQLRLRFSTDDNNDNGADIIRFFSGNAAVFGVRPILMISYYVP